MVYTRNIPYFDSDKKMLFGWMFVCPRVKESDCCLTPNDHFSAISQIINYLGEKRWYWYGPDVTRAIGDTLTK
jgi:hypothetical protein